MTMLLPDHAGALLASNLHNREVLAQLARPAYAVHIRQDDMVPTGCSRVGGLPDLPADMAWPEWQEQALKFIAQINLTELPPMPDRHLLPSQGMLYFFYGIDCGDEPHPYGTSPEERGLAQVIHVDVPVEPLASRSEPDNMPWLAAEERHIDLEGCMQFSLESTFPDAEHPVWQRLAPDRTSWGTIWDYTREVIAIASGKVEPPLPRRWHQILGHPRPMQSAVGYDVESNLTGEPPGEEPARSNWYRRAEEWELLFQILDMGGDCSLYYVIRRNDLLAQKFERAWWARQCT